MGSGSDITAVTLCGIAAGKIVSQSNAEVVIVTPAGDVDADCDIVVVSTSFGTSIFLEGYTFDSQYDPSCPGMGGVITGVTPNNGPYYGGNAITIRGTNLGKGNDISSVKIRNMIAPVLDQNTTYAVVTVPNLGYSGLGDIVIRSRCYGTTIKRNGYLYNARTLNIVFSFWFRFSVVGL